LEQSTPIPTAIRANLFQAAGFLTVRLPQNHARAYFTRGFELYQEAGDRLGVGWALNGLGFDALVRGDHGEARKQFAESLAIARSLHDQELTAQVLTNLGYLACAEGDYEHARKRTEHGLRFARIVKNHRWMAFALNNLIVVALKLHRYADVRSHLQATMRVLDELRDQQVGADVLAYIAAVAHADGQWEQAAQFLAAGEALREPLAGLLPVGTGIDRADMLAALHTHLDATTFAAVWEAGHRMTLDAALVAAQNVILSIPMGSQPSLATATAVGGTGSGSSTPQHQQAT
jgi:tetratricopeptide (TPR) repeat protein